MHESASNIYDKYHLDLTARYGDALVNQISREKFINLINNTRGKITGGDYMKAIREPSLANLGTNDPRPFLQFCFTFRKTTASTGDGGKFHEILGFGHPELIRLCNYTGLDCFYDATFKCTPKPFTQCIIFMILDNASGLYIPVFFVLVDSKTERTNYYTLQCMLSNEFIHQQFRPKSISCDFERAEINAIHRSLPDVTVIGCLFHFKQAIRRKLVELNIPENQISTAMTPGNIDILTIVPERRVKDTIAYLKEKIPREGVGEQWDKFWNYFQKTWLQSYKIHEWNISKQIEQKE